MESKQAPNLKALVLDYFANNHIEEALVVVTSANEDYVNDQFWELVPAVCEYFTAEKSSTQPDVVTACEQMLNHIASVANVKELLLVLLEQADSFKDDVKFKALLQPIQKCLLKLPGNKTHSIGISLETLYAHIKSLPLPDDKKLEGQERILLDQDDNVTRCCNVTRHFLDFMTPLVEEVSWKKGLHEKRKKHHRLVLDLTKYLIRVLDHPLSHLDLTHRDQEEGENRPPPKSASRRCAETVIDLLAKLQGNFPQMVLSLMEENEQAEAKQTELNKKRENAKKNNEGFDELDNYFVEESVPMLGLSTFCYLAFGERLDNDSLPQVLTSRYYIETNCIFITHLLDHKESLVIHKGLLLLSKLQANLPDQSFNSMILEAGEVKDLIFVLTKVMTSSQVKELSQLAVCLLKNLLKKFDIPGRNQFLLYLLSTTKHSGLAGYIINLLKDEIDDNLKRDAPNLNFVGSRLWRLLELVFRLPAGEKTDLLENSDRIMAALNILRYLIIRDKPSSDVTGIWSRIPQIRDTYCELLHKGINLSRVHYELEMKKTKERKSKSGPEISFNIGDQSTAGLNKKQEIFAIQMALCTFDMMESILGRVTELIDQQEKASHKLNNATSNGKRFVLGSRCLYSTGQNDHATQKVSADRTKLEGDIYDDTPELEAQKQYEESKKKEEEEEAKLKSRLFNAALRYVPKYGWSKKAIIEGATAEGLPPLTHGLASKGAIELVHHFYDSANQELANKLAKEAEEVELGKAEKKRTTVFVKDAITFRLYLLVPYLDNWPQAMALMALPQNVPESLKKLGHLVDDIWYYAGDKSVDLNWYTRRALLAAAYNSTELYMMQDKSADFADTWAFLDRRLEDLRTVGQGFRQVQETSYSLGNLLLGSCIMARNVLGINDRFR